MEATDRLEIERKGYQWPASALTCREMEILADWRAKTGTPISELIRQAINECQRIITKEGTR